MTAYLGCHLSSSKGYLAMAKEAFSIGANTCQYFSRNPRGGSLKEFDEADAEAFLAFSKEHGMGAYLTHAPYVLNPAAATEELRAHTLDVMKEDVMRLEYFPDSMYNFHPGAHVGQGEEAGITYISSFLNALIVPGQKTKILLETMAGKGTEMGKTFEEIATILDRVTYRDHVGVCMDTCHVFDGGYDIRDDLESVLRRFDETVGLERLCAMHLNDSKNVLGSHKDRHEKIGEGNIGIDAFRAIMNHPALKSVPKYLETPNDTEGYGKEIAMLKALTE